MQARTSLKPQVRSSSSGSASGLSDDVRTQTVVRGTPAAKGHAARGNPKSSQHVQENKNRYINAESASHSPINALESEQRVLTKAETVAAFIKKMPAPTSIRLEPVEFWNGLGVWHARVVDENMIDQQWMATNLARLGRTMLEALATWLDLATENSTTSQLAVAISKKAQTSGNEEWSCTLFLIDALVHNRSHRAIEEVVKLLLVDSADDLIKGDFTPRGRRLAIALQLYVTAPADLGLMMLYERAERYSYNRFVLADGTHEAAIFTQPNGHRYTIADPLGTAFNGFEQTPGFKQAPGQDSGQDLGPGFRQEGVSVGDDPFAARSVGHRNGVHAAEASIYADSGAEHTPPQGLTTDQVDIALQEFESGSRGGRHSRCMRILHQPPETTVVFIRRVLRQRSIAEMERTIFGDEVETIVLKFHNRMRVVEERSTKGVGVVIAQAIAKRVLGHEARYGNDRTLTPLAALRGFLSALRHGDDAKLTFVELHLKSAPLVGSPTLMLRGTSDLPISSALGVLEEKGITLMDDLADIRHVGVVYETQNHGTLCSHIFKLRFEINEAQQGIIRYMAAQASSAICQSFEEHIRTTHEITVIPAAR